MNLEDYRPHIARISRHLAWKIKDLPLEVEDLESAGWLGLMDASRLYDPGKGSFFSYAKFKIWHAINDQIRDMIPGWNKARRQKVKGERPKFTEIEEHRIGFDHFLPVDERIHLKSLLKAAKMTEQESIIVRFLSIGFNQKEIADKFRKSEAWVSQRIADIRRSSK